MLQDRLASYERAGGASALPRDTEITAFAVVNRMLSGEAAAETAGGGRRLQSPREEPRAVVAAGEGPRARWQCAAGRA